MKILTKRLLILIAISFCSSSYAQTVSSMLAKAIIENKIILVGYGKELEDSRQEFLIANYGADEIIKQNYIRLTNLNVINGFNRVPALSDIIINSGNGQEVRSINLNHDEESHLNEKSGEEKLFTQRPYLQADDIDGRQIRYLVILEDKIAVNATEVSPAEFKNGFESYPISYQNGAFEITEEDPEELSEPAVNEKQLNEFKAIYYDYVSNNLNSDSLGKNKSTFAVNLIRNLLSASLNECKIPIYRCWVIKTVPDSLKRLINDDPDSDSVRNIEEYAFGSDPNSGIQKNRPVTIIKDGKPVFRYFRNIKAIDLRYTLEFSSDMVSYSAFLNYSGDRIVGLADDGYEIHDVDLIGAPGNFVRVKVDILLKEESVTTPTPAVTNTSAPYCTPVLCSNGQLICPPGSICAGGCGMVCITLTPTATATPIKTFTATATRTATQTVTPTQTPTATPIPIIGSCGTAAKKYESTATVYSGTFCTSGTAPPATPAFPEQGTYSSWSCVGFNGGSNATCYASRYFPPQNGSCGAAAKAYAITDTAFSGVFCATGSASPAAPAFPAQSGATSWVCGGLNGGIAVGCTATRASGDALSWQQVGATASWNGVASSHDGRILAAVTWDRISISTDGGLTWQIRGPAKRGGNRVAMSADGTKIAVAAYEGGIQTSSDSGVTWQDRPAAGIRRWGAIASSWDGTRLVALDARYPDGRIYISTDSGASWTAQGPVLGSWAWVASSADGMKLVIVGGWGGLVHTSSDGGVTWVKQNVPPQPWASVASSEDGNMIVAGTSGRRLFTSKDSGKTWQEGTIDGNWSAVSSSLDGTKLVAVQYSNPGAIFTSTDSGATWQQQAGAGIRKWNSVASSADGTSVIASVYEGGLYVNRLQQ